MFTRVKVSQGQNLSQPALHTACPRAEVLLDFTWADSPREFPHVTETSSTDIHAPCALRHTGLQARAVPNGQTEHHSVTPLPTRVCGSSRLPTPPLLRAPPCTPGHVWGELDGGWLCARSPAQGCLLVPHSTCARESCLLKLGVEGHPCPAWGAGPRPHGEGSGLGSSQCARERTSSGAPAGNGLCRRSWLKLHIWGP